VCVGLLGVWVCVGGCCCCHGCLGIVGGVFVGCV
jgi:hypothetical protein